MIRSSKHLFTKTLNPSKWNKLNQFVDGYTIAVNRYVNYLWNNEVKWLNNVFDISKDQLDCPAALNYKLVSFETDLSARALSSAATQACGIVKSVIEKRKRLLWLKEKLEKEKGNAASVIKRLKNMRISQPVLHQVNPELSSKCADFKEIRNGHFNAFLRLKSLGQNYGSICIPVSYHKQSLKWKRKGKLLGGFSISKTSVTLRYAIENQPLKKTGRIIGIDQGVTDCITTSDSQKFVHPHYHTLSSILDKLSRKKKGSKAFQRAVRLRENFINWSVNQINTTGIRQINLEKVFDLRRFKQSSRKLSHWTYTLIEKKLDRYCEESRVWFSLQSSTYRSQRCSRCGLVRKSNRKGKLFSCKGCGFSDDSDHNAALNHVCNLPDIPFYLRKMRKNLGDGFYWKPSGFFTVSGQEFRVPDSAV